jgi:arginine repressor
LVNQYIRHNNEITVDEIKEKLSTTHHSSVSATTIRRHLHEYGYRNISSKSTHMLTSYDKKRRVQWAKQHQDDDFKRKFEKRKPQNIDELELF